MSVELTEEQRALLRDEWQIAYMVLVDSSDGIDRLRTSSMGGAHRGFRFQVAGSKIEASWSVATVVSRAADGTPSRLTFAEPHRFATLTLARLQRWAEQLPADVTARARQLRAGGTAERRALVLEVVGPAVDAPAEQLGLFDLAGAQ